MEHPVVEFSRLWNTFCATGDGGGVDPSCSPGKGGDFSPSVDRLTVDASDLSLWDWSALGGESWTPFAEAIDNAFCPTGPGGGQDNSCSPGGGGSGDDEPEYGSDITDRLAATAETRMEFEDWQDDLKSWDKGVELGEYDLEYMRKQLDEADQLIRAEEFQGAAKIHMDMYSTLRHHADTMEEIGKQKFAEASIQLRRSQDDKPSAHLVSQLEYGKAMREAADRYRTQAKWHKSTAEELDDNYKPSPTRPNLRNEWTPFAAAF